MYVNLESKNKAPTITALANVSDAMIKGLAEDENEKSAEYEIVVGLTRNSVPITSDVLLEGNELIVGQKNYPNPFNVPVYSA